MHILTGLLSLQFALVSCCWTDDMVYVRVGSCHVKKSNGHANIKTLGASKSIQKCSGQDILRIQRLEGRQCSREYQEEAAHEGAI